MNVQRHWVGAVDALVPRSENGPSDWTALPVRLIGSKAAGRPDHPNSLPSFSLLDAPSGGHGWLVVENGQPCSCPLASTRARQCGIATPSSSLAAEP